MTPTSHRVWPNKKSFSTAVGLLVLLVVLFFSSQSATVFNSASASNKREKPINKGYIVELAGPPLGTNGQKQPKGAAAISTKQAKTEQETAKKKIFQILGKNENNSPLLAQYSTVLNGFALDISKDEADKLKKDHSLIKRITPNYQVKALLNESVPMINAHKVWAEKDSNGRQVTGEGVTVAVIDTGVDYTHPDLGKTEITERPLTQITQDPIPNRNVFQTDDQLMSYDNGRLAYLNGNKINVYSFAAKTTRTYSLLTNTTSPIRLVLKDNLVVYFAEHVSGAVTPPSLYTLDLRTGKNKRIVTGIKAIGLLAIENNKVIYGGSKDDGTDYSYVFIYDLKTKKEKRISLFGIDSLNIMPRVSGNLVLQSIASTDNCYDKLTVYDISSSKSKDLTPMDIGPVMDFEGNKVLYAACSKTNFDSSWSTYYLYDLTTGENKKITYPKENLTGYKSEVSKKNYLEVSYINKGVIGNNVVFFSKYADSSRIGAYDMKQDRYVQINLLKSSFTMDGGGKKICFVSEDWNIFCHLYDPTNSYPLPATIFNNKVIGGYNFINGTPDPYDDVGHGTHVASIIASNGPLKGVAPGAKIVAYKVLDANGFGSESDIIAAIEKAAQTRLDEDPANDIDVINMSLGAECLNGQLENEYSEGCGPDDPMSLAIDRAAELGIVSAIAAGNSGDWGQSTVTTPGTARKAITVGAIDKNKVIPTFSSKGPVIWKGENLNKPDLVAPGVDICAARKGLIFPDRTCFDQSHIAVSGTSMAAPHITGLAALTKQAKPEWSVAQIKTYMKESALDLGVDINKQGAGLVDALFIFGPHPLPSKSPTPTPIIPPCGKTYPCPSSSERPTPTNTATPSPSIVPTATPSPTPTPTTSPTPSAPTCTASCYQAYSLGNCSQGAPCKTTQERNNVLPYSAYIISTTGACSSIAVDTSTNQFSGSETPTNTWLSAVTIHPQQPGFTSATWNFCNGSVCWTFNAGQTLYWRLRDPQTNQVKAICSSFTAPTTK